MSTPRMIPKVSIAGAAIDVWHEPLVIAEIGVNHDGSVARAVELVSAAKAAGAGAVKLQVFRADTLMHASAQFAAYQQSQVDDADAAAMLRRYELSDEQLAEIAGRARDVGMPLIATPFSLQDIERLRPLGLAAVKLASPDMVNTPLMCAAAGLGLPLIVSTGASTEAEIDAAVELLSGMRAATVLLHCVSSYPTPDEQLELRQISRLGRFGMPVGYSDHSTEIITAGLAVAAGACVLERHLTYDKQASGPDHAASSSPGEMAEYVALARRSWRMMGTMQQRKVLDVERDVRRVSRQSLVMARDCAAGERITHQHLTVQRPGTGVPAGRWREVVGRTAARALAGGQMLSEGDLV